MNAEKNKDIIFNVLYVTYKKSVLRFIYTFVKNLAICEELAQDVFCRIYEKELIFSGFDENATRNYLFSIARSITIDYLRRERTRESRLREAVYAEADYADIVSESLEDYYIEGEVFSELQDIINTFPEKMRAVFIEAEIGIQHKGQISKEFNISLYKIRKIQDEIKRSIKKKLNQYYDDDVA